jgi:hypothetical protein
MVSSGVAPTQGVQRTRGLINAEIAEIAEDDGVRPAFGRRESVESIYVPPPAIRELREICRWRHQVIRLRTRVSQMIRALLLRHGVSDVPVGHVFSARGLAWLEQLTLQMAAGPHHPCGSRRHHALPAVGRARQLCQARAAQPCSHSFARCSAPSEPCPT